MYTGHNYSPVGLDDRKQHTRRGGSAFSLRQIAAGLNAKGITAARGGSWTREQVRRVLECAMITDQRERLQVWVGCHRSRKPLRSGPPAYGPGTQALSP
nr:recombinase family protein [Microvirga ossetica]